MKTRMMLLSIALLLALPAGAFAQGRTMIELLETVASLEGQGDRLETKLAMTEGERDRLREQLGTAQRSGEETAAQLGRAERELESTRLRVAELEGVLDRYKSGEARRLALQAVEEAKGEAELAEIARDELRAQASDRQIQAYSDAGVSPMLFSVADMPEDVWGFEDGDESQIIWQQFPDSKDYPTVLVIGSFSARGVDRPGMRHISEETQAQWAIKRAEIVAAELQVKGFRTIQATATVEARSGVLLMYFGVGFGPEYVQSLAKDVAGLQGAIDAIKERIANLERRMSQAETRLTEHGDSIGDLKRRVHGLEIAFPQAELGIAAIFDQSDAYGAFETGLWVPFAESGSYELSASLGGGKHGTVLTARTGLLGRLGGIVSLGAKINALVAWSGGFKTVHHVDLGFGPVLEIELGTPWLILELQPFVGVQIEGGELGDDLAGGWSVGALAVLKARLGKKPEPIEAPPAE
ncbi:MAG: hypothetical protein WCW16_04470 [Candidatus Magasanikbacteria bacterium]